MGTYGPNFDWRQSPDPQHRLGRFKTGAAVLRQGTPVIRDAVATDADGRATLRRAIATDTIATALLSGRAGVLVYEAPYTAYVGMDRALTRPSDLVDVPAGSPAQVCHGNECKMHLVNTADTSFEGQRDYVGFAKQVKLAGLAIGDRLAPGADDADDFLWAEAGADANAWAVVTNLLVSDAPNNIGWVEAQLLF